MLHALQLLACLATLTLFLLEKTLVLRLNLLNPRCRDPVGFLGRLQLTPHLDIGLFAPVNCLSTAGSLRLFQLLLERLLIFQQFLVLLGHEVGVVHRLNFFHGFLKELGLVMCCISVVCKGANRLIDGWDVRVRLQ